MKFHIKNILTSFIRFFNLIRNPHVEWQKIKEETIRIPDLLGYFLLPILTISSLLVFAGINIHDRNLGVSIAHFFITFISLFLGLYSASRIIELLAPNFQIKNTRKDFIILIFLSGSVLCIFHGISKLFTPFSLLNQLSLIMELYFIRVLWVGSKYTLNMSNAKQSGFIIIASILCLVLPFIFERMFSVLFGLPITI